MAITEVIIMSNKKIILISINVPANMVDEIMIVDLFIPFISL